MMKKNKPLTIGISEQGRVFPEIKDILTRANYDGIDWDSGEKEFLIPDTNINLVLVKGIEEIAYQVESQMLDGVMIGSDVVMESNQILEDVGARRSVQDPNLMNSVVDTGRSPASLRLLKPQAMNFEAFIGRDVPPLILSKYSLLAYEQTRGLPRWIDVREIESKADVLAGKTQQMAYDIVFSGDTMRKAGLEDFSGQEFEWKGGVRRSPEKIQTSLQLFNTRASEQDNAMIDFGQRIASVVEAS